MDDRSLESLIGRSVEPGSLRKEGMILIATADTEGLPHLASAGSLSVLSPDRVRVRYWFCPQTLANLARNRGITVVFWRPEQDRGYQLAGQVEKVEETVMLDGLAPREENEAIPQSEQELLIRVHKVTVFSYAPHGDREVPFRRGI